MAKTKAADAATARARVLTDFDTYGLKVGQIFEGEKSVVDELVALGAADANPEAVAYAEGEGAEVVTQPSAAE
jgi:hypothetical protein